MLQIYEKTLATNHLFPGAHPKEAHRIFLGGYLAFEVIMSAISSNSPLNYESSAQNTAHRMYPINVFNRNLNKGRTFSSCGVGVEEAQTYLNSEHIFAKLL